MKVINNGIGEYFTIYIYPYKLVYFNKSENLLISYTYLLTLSVYVTKIIDKRIATVYCCDYGKYGSINIEELVPLQDKFYKLPYQAIWAELYGKKQYL